MRIVTFNIKAGWVAPGRFDGRLLARTCAGFAADVLALQEVDIRAVRSRFANQAAMVGRATGLTPVFGEAARRGPWRRYGNALLSRGVVSDVEVVSLPAPAGGEHRVAILARVVLDGGRALSVCATHLSFRKGEGPVQLAELLTHFETWSLPRVLLGDLNIGPEIVEPAVTSAGYTLAPTGPTFPNAAPRTRIDFVAVAGLEIVAVEVPAVPVSDHRPVVVDCG